MNNPNNNGCQYPKDRMSIFVDGNNMFYAQQKNPPQLALGHCVRRVLCVTSLDHVAFLLNYFCVCGLYDLNMGNKKRPSQETIAQIITLKRAGHQAKEISLSLSSFSLRVFLLLVCNGQF